MVHLLWLNIHKEVMENGFFVPPDNAESQIKPDDAGSSWGGVCGPSTIAVLTQRPVETVIAK